MQRDMYFLFYAFYSQNSEQLHKSSIESVKSNSNPNSEKSLRIALIIKIYRDLTVQISLQKFRVWDMLVMYSDRLGEHGNTFHNRNEIVFLESWAIRRMKRNTKFAF